MTFAFQAVSAAVPGWFWEVCALEGDPNLRVLSPGAQVSRGVSLPPLPQHQYWLVLAEAVGKSPNSVTLKVAEVY